MAFSVLVFYFSGGGHTKQMAESVAEGIREAGREVVLKPAEEVSVADLKDAAALAVGTPTYFSNIAWPVKKVIDESIALYGEGGGYALKGRPCAIFTSSVTEPDARDCIGVLELTFGRHHQMELLPSVIGLDRQPEEEKRARCLALGRSLAEAL